VSSGESIRLTVAGSAPRCTFARMRSTLTPEANTSQQGSIDNLITSPVFILSPFRSGSTLLRCVLNMHSQICAGPELSLGDTAVKLDPPADETMQELGLSRENLEYLLWDRILDWRLRRSGKSIIVDKTPRNVFIWQRISECWPHAKYIYLIRHPVHTLDSMIAGVREPFLFQRLPEAIRSIVAADSRAGALAMLAPMIEALLQARAALPGLTIRYEDLTSCPAEVTRAVCDFLGVQWEREMIDYGERMDVGQFRMPFGDWSDKIKSGKIHPSRPHPADHEIPNYLKKMCHDLGYLGHSTDGTAR
jgi:hypothetical protein